MRWACTLVAQVFPRRLNDLVESGMSDMFFEDNLAQQLARFRRGLLCSAALHTQASVSGVAQLRKGVFSAQEYLRDACEKGTGLPFGEPHTKAISSEKSLSTDIQSLSRRIRDNFRILDVEKLSKFETCHLEWLAVFLSVPDWGSRISSTESFSTESDSFSSTNVAIDNLTSQLGVASSGLESGLFFPKCLTSFPLFKNTLQRIICGNRNLLEASQHIDNMLALSTGSQIHFNSKKAETAQRIKISSNSVGIADMKNLYSSNESIAETSEPDVADEYDQGIYLKGREKRPETTVPGSSHSSREADRFMYLLLTDDPESTLLGQRITFLGCSIESLRSSLTVWVQNNPKSPASVWSPSFKRTGTEEHERFTFRASDSFAKCFKLKDWDMLVKERHAQLRLLWELQNYFHHLIPEEGLSPE